MIKLHCYSNVPLFSLDHNKNQGSIGIWQWNSTYAIVLQVEYSVKNSFKANKNLLK
jgi:hypothetical protein